MSERRSYDAAANAILAQIFAMPEFARISEIGGDVAIDAGTLREIVEAAATFSAEILAPFGRASDQLDCSLCEGRVVVVPGHSDVWSKFIAGGWTTIEAPTKFGGAGLPGLVHSACEELFNRASPGFGMLPTPMRCAVRVIERYGSDSLKEEWLPHLIDGSWGATICISEADAGSDVPRLRTVATPGEDGLWLVSGEKMWISFGDHDLCSRIGHLVLARTRDASTTLTGLSLFLVPSEIAGETNHVLVRRIEEKLGLHCSPTCALGFENAKGWLIGTPGRGLSQLFTMIVGMRLSVGSQGAGIAGAAAALAWRYAAERRQGGRPDVPPVTIDQHGDVRRMLLAIAARAEVARGLVLTASAIDDLRTREPDDVAKAEAADQLAWLLPITKNFCAEAAFTCASEAIQVLGGAGYTREWQAEQYLRDARVLSIYEGTSGMQALDLVTRRVIGGEGRAMKAFLTRAKQDIEKSAGTWAAGQLSMLLEMLDVASQDLDAEQAAVIAYPFLQIASLATTGWIALRLANLSGNTMNNHLAALGRHWLRLSVPLALAEAQQIAMGTDLVTEYCFVDASNIIGRTL